MGRPRWAERSQSQPGNPARHNGHTDDLGCRKELPVRSLAAATDEQRTQVCDMAAAHIERLASM
jgi:hypothetical protein